MHVTLSHYALPFCEVFKKFAPDVYYKYMLGHNLNSDPTAALPLSVGTDM